MTDFGRFLELYGVTPNSGATDAEFDVFEAQTGLTLPPELRRLYELSNGLAIDRRGRMRIHRLDEVADFVHNFESFGIPTVWGYFPFTDRNDSNPHCVCCAGPATDYVVRVNHDDIARIEYRSVGSFFAAVRRVIEGSGEPNDSGEVRTLRDLPRDLYPNTSDRTPQDVETARRLLAFAGTLEEGSVERADAERWAITLLSENEVADVVRLLDEGDQYRRSEALTKLTAMTAPAAQEAVRRHRREMREFVNRSVAALREAGIEVAEVNRDVARLKPGRVWFDLPAFFHRRHFPTILNDVVRRAQELIALKTQGNA